MSTDREQWIRERGEKLFDELYDIHFISVSPRPNALLAISECLKEVGALSPPQAVDEKGIREAAEIIKEFNERLDDMWNAPSSTRMSDRRIKPIEALQKRSFQWLQSQCPSAPQGDIEKAMDEMINEACIMTVNPDGVWLRKKLIKLKADYIKNKSNMSNNRQLIYVAIDSERDYQDSRWNENTTASKGQHSPEEWYMYMEDYINEAKHILSREPVQSAYPKAMDIMRKVASMAVCAMEQHGVANRKPLTP
jgi:hypothetical protein